MKYKKIPFVEKEVSQIFFGTATKPFLEGENMEGVFDAICEMGVNTFDLARVYGKAENIFGKWLKKRGCREDLILLSKCGHPTAGGTKRVNEKEMRKDFALTAGELGTDYIDIYLLHRDDPEIPVGEIVEIFNALHAEGKIGAFGASNWTHQRIEQANEYAYQHNLQPFSVSSPHFGLAEQICDLWGGGCVTISGRENADARAWYREQNIPVVAYSSLAHGFFSGKFKSSEAREAGEILGEEATRGYVSPENIERLKRCEELALKKGVTVPQIAMAWIYQQPLNVFAVVSTSKPERMKENIAALEIKLTPEETAWLNLGEE